MKKLGAYSERQRSALRLLNQKPIEEHSAKERLKETRCYSGRTGLDLHIKGSQPPFMGPRVKNW